MLKFYDSDLQSDHPPENMLSGHEAPRDKIKDKKLIGKEELSRYYKEIWHVKKLIIIIIHILFFIF